MRQSNYSQAGSQNTALPTSPPYRAFIGGISFEAGEGEIREELLQGIPLKSLRFPPSRDEHAHRGFCYVEFNTVDDLAKALERNGTSINDRPCRIDVSTSDASSYTPTRAPAANMGSWRGAGDQVVGREESQAASASSFRARSPGIPSMVHSSTGTTNVTTTSSSNQHHYHQAPPPSKWRNDDSSMITTASDAASAVAINTVTTSTIAPSMPRGVSAAVPRGAWRDSAGKVVSSGEAVAVAAAAADPIRKESWREDKKEQQNQHQQPPKMITGSWRKD